MRCYYDLHIHSCLSACADVLLSPNNIFNMAHLKGMNIISVTDHNSLKQYPVLMEIAESYDMLLIPGVEVTTIEDIDLLIYFKSIDDAMLFDQKLESYHQKRPYNKDVYGTQVITDHEDQYLGEIDYLLSRPLDLSILDLISILETFDHILIPAHLNKPKKSAIFHLSQFHFDAVELILNADVDTFIKNHQLEQYKIVYNSDAHQLIDISEKNARNHFTMDHLDIDAFFRYFKHG
jgi:3',5'-nucleoside bisphosphate phosphatase